MIPIGTSVLVSKLKKHGEIVEILGDGVYKVAIGALTVRVKEKEIAISAQPARPKSKDAVAGPEGIQITSDAPRQWESLRKLDLHGMTVQEALRALEDHLSRSVLANIHEVEIMHGQGTGTLKDAVVKHLGTLPAVKGIQPHTFNRGITRVFL